MLVRAKITQHAEVEVELGEMVGQLARHIMRQQGLALGMYLKDGEVWSTETFRGESTEFCAIPYPTDAQRAACLMVQQLLDYTGVRFD